MIKCVGEMSREELQNEVIMWRRCYLDQPEDRLYHAKDKTWWYRNDYTYLGVGGLFKANPPEDI